MKKTLMKALAIFLLVTVFASGNGITVFAEGLTDEIQEIQETESEESGTEDSSESEEAIIDEEASESKESESEEEDSESEESVSEDDTTQEGASEEENASEEQSESAAESESEEIVSEESEEESSDDMLVDEEKFLVESQEEVIVESGTWGESVHWKLNEEGVLTVTQDEDVEYEYFEDKAPWSEYAGDVKKLVWGANCLQDLGYRGAISAIDFGNTKWNSSNSRYENDYPNLEVIEFTKHVSMKYITDMSYMFYGCSSLVSLDVSGFDTSNVTSMSYMFYGCSSLASLDVSGFDTVNVTSMSSMFYGCSSLAGLDVSGFDTVNVTSMSYMFSGCSSLQNLDVSGFDTVNVTSMSSMFNGCSSVEELDVSGFDTVNVTRMSSMFGGCSSVEELDVSGFDTVNVTSMSYMFGGCSSVEELDVSGFDTSNVTTMLSMFYGCSSLAILDASGFDTSNVESMLGMFDGCNDVTSLDVSGFDTSNVKNMSYMFYGCNDVTSLDVSGFDTSNVTSMSYMFNGCNSLTSLDVSGFDTGKVTSMSSMFAGCSRLTELDVSGFDTVKVTSMSSMFYGCSCLKNLQLAYFDCAKVTSGSLIFDACDSLEKIEAPLNVQCTIKLPSNKAWGEWHIKDGTDTYTELPKGLAESFTLVRELRSDRISPTGLYFEQEQIEMYRHAAAYLNVKMEPQNANDKRVVWTSSNPAIVTVSSNGYVSTKGSVGEAVITVSSLSNPEVYATCKIIVNGKSSGLKVSLDCPMEYGDYVMFKGDSFELNLQWDDGEPWEEVVYEVSNDTAEFKNGKLIAKETGFGTLHISAKSGEVQGPETWLYYYIYEEPGKPMLNTEQVFFDVHSTGTKEREFLLEADVINRDATHSNVTFSISGSSNLQLTDHGNNTATIQYLDKHPGSAVVTVTAVDGEKKSAKCIVTVGNQIKGISIESSLPWYNPITNLLLNGKTAQLKAVLTPTNASLKGIRWESSDSTVISVDQKGKIKAHKTGDSTIYAYATDGSGAYGYRSISVRNAVDKIELKVLKNGEECSDKVVALYEPGNNSFFSMEGVAFDKYGNSDSESVSNSFEWQISGTGAKNAYINNKSVYYNKPGTITVTAAALDGSKKKASIKVKVEQHAYQLDAKAPKNTYVFTQKGQTYWQMESPSKKTTITPVMQYNGGKTAPDAKWKKYEIILSEAAQEVMQTDKKGTGIVIAANATPGDYEVIFRALDDTRVVEDSVIIRISDTVYDAKVVWPTNVMPTGQTQMLAEGVKLSLSTSVNGKAKNASYQYTWKLEGDASNEGEAQISSKGVLDLKKAKAGDGYALTLTISRGGENIQTVVHRIQVTAQMKKESVKLMIAGTAEEFPAKMEPLYAANGKAVSVVLPEDCAELYQVSGGKKGVLRIEESASGYVLYSDGTGSAKVTVKAMDGSNFKKDFTYKVEKPEDAVAQFIVPKGTISLSGKQPEYIQYKILTKDGEVPTDCRIKWEISDRNKVYFLVAGSNAKEMITNQASGNIALMGANATLRNVTLKGTTMDGSNKKVKINLKVDDWFKLMTTSSIFQILPPNGSAYIAETGEPLLIHGKSMKFDVQCNFIGYNKNRLTYTISGLNESGEEVVSEADLKLAGITIKNGVLKVSSKCSYSGKIKVQVNYTKQTDIEPSSRTECYVQIKPAVNKVMIQNTSGETVTKVNVQPGEAITFKANLSGKTGEELVYQGVTWTVSDKKYASVTKDGVVTIAANAPKKKTIKVTATAQDGSGKKATVTITVK